MCCKYAFAPVLHLVLVMVLVMVMVLVTGGLSSGLSGGLSSGLSGGLSGVGSPCTLSMCHSLYQIPFSVSLSGFMGLRGFPYNPMGFLG